VKLLTKVGLKRIGDGFYKTRCTYRVSSYIAPRIGLNQKHIQPTIIFLA